MAKIVTASILLLAATGCTHQEVWESATYVAPGSVEYQRLRERLETLYRMTCRLPGGDRSERTFIINGRHVVLLVPDRNGRQCRTAIPYAICEAPPDQSPTTLCRRIK